MRGEGATFLARRLCCCDWGRRLTTGGRDRNSRVRNALKQLHWLFHLYHKPKGFAHKTAMTLGRTSEIRGAAELALE
eukprot:869805-Pyramimonas_sp.AAC.1